MMRFGLLPVIGFFAVIAGTAAAQPAAPAGQATNAPASFGAPHTCKGYYPPDAVDAGIGGRTLLGFTVTANGTVENPQVLETSGHATLDEAAAACARLWLYTPARWQGNPVAIPWKAYVYWVSEPPEDDQEARLRVVRRSAWQCLWNSGAVSHLPADLTTYVGVHISFTGPSHGHTIGIWKTSGSETIDDAAMQCVDEAPGLAALDSNANGAQDENVWLAWWRSSPPAASAVAPGAGASPANAPQ